MSDHGDEAEASVVAVPTQDEEQGEVDGTGEASPEEAAAHLAPLGSPKKEPGDGDDDSDLGMDDLTDEVPLSLIATHVDDSDQEIHITKLTWDKTGTEGQIRKLKPALVAKYSSGMIKDGPPRNRVRILVKARDGMQSLFHLRIVNGFCFPQTGAM